MLKEELRTVLRRLTASWRYVVVAALTLGIGLGLNTMVFSIVDAVVLDPLPAADTHGVVKIREISSRSGREGLSSYSDVASWAEQSTAIKEFALYRDRNVVVALPGGSPEEVPAEAVSPNLFTLLRVRPLIGRVFGAADGAPGADRVIILSYKFWSERLTGTTGEAIGKTIHIDGEPHTVIAVMPPRFGFPDNQLLWLPIQAAARDQPRDTRVFRVIGRLSAGHSLDQAQVEMRIIEARLSQAYPVLQERNVQLADFDDSLPTQIRIGLWLVLAAVIFVLMIACANVAALAMNRHWSRQREAAIRLAMGASRGQLARLVLFESVLIGLLGGIAGIPLAYGGFAFLRQLVPFDLPLGVAMSFNWKVLLFTIAASVGAGVLFGAAPILMQSATTESALLREGVHGRAQHPRREWARFALLVGQLALSTVLLVGALLMVRSLRNVHTVDPGFHTRGLVSARVSAAGGGNTARDERLRFFENVLGELEGLPGGVAATTGTPLTRGTGRVSVSVEDAQTTGLTEGPSAEYRGVSAGYGTVLGIPIEQGRWITRADVASHAAVAVINRSLARRLWPNASPLEQGMRIGDRRYRIIGVIADIPRIGGDGELAHQVFVPFSLMDPRQLTVVIKARDAAGAIGLLRSAVARIDRGAPISNVMGMDKLVSNAFWQQRMFGGLFVLFAAMASFLAALGVYGSISHATSVRSQEVSIRMALGATSQKVILLLTRRGILVAILGLTLGTMGAVGVSWLLAPLLLGIHPLDPLVYVSAIVLLGAAVVLASYVPARRVTRANRFRIQLEH